MAKTKENLWWLVKAVSFVFVFAVLQSEGVSDSLLAAGSEHGLEILGFLRLNCPSCFNYHSARMFCSKRLCDENWSGYCRCHGEKTITSPTVNSVVHHGSMILPGPDLSCVHDERKTTVLSQMSCTIVASSSGFILESFLNGNFQTKVNILSFRKFHSQIVPGVLSNVLGFRQNFCTWVCVASKISVFCTVVSLKRETAVRRECNLWFPDCHRLLNTS